MLNKLIKDEKGMGLVETIAALGIAIMVITALVSLAIFTLRTSQNSKFLLQGSKLANEGVERVRAYRESMVWGTFVNNLRECDDGLTDRCSVIWNGSSYVFSSTSPSNVEVISYDATSTLEDVTRSFRAFDPADDPTGTAANTISGTEDLIRLEVVVSWAIGGQTKTARIYTDMSNWRGD